ncbi:MAG: response regulator transcription factor [Chitinophagales bacterium]|nr:response regulator transcription factor [Chitinophagales bacterium]
MKTHPPKKTRKLKPTAELTVRELEVLKLAAQKPKTKQIAELLFISPATVETHKARIYKKLEVDNITDAIMVGIRNKWID